VHLIPEEDRDPFVALIQAVRGYAEGRIGRAELDAERDAAWAAREAVWAAWDVAARAAWDVAARAAWAACGAVWAAAARAAACGAAAWNARAAARYTQIEMLRRYV
jgi:hypothetical protein